MLELVAYQDKCKLIKGWDDLFNKLKEHIESLAAMRLSPYYKVLFFFFFCYAFLDVCTSDALFLLLLKEFEEETTNWEGKLNRLNSIFDVWIEAQRRWVYLDGIFGSSADIKHLLPNETQKFQT
jgi:dynein heavy chain 1, cytosolic